MSSLMDPGWTREMNKGQPSPREAGGGGECKTGGRIPGEGDVEKDDHGPQVQEGWEKQGPTGKAIVFEQSVVTGMSLHGPRGAVCLDQDFLPWTPVYTFY